MLRGTDESGGWNVNRTVPLTWHELEWLRGLTGLPLVLKGIRTAEDAHVAAESGIDGVLVSTHGGRQLDMTMGAIEMVPEVVDAVKGNCEVYVDSGVRRGSDVVKALALGAKAVGIGRPLFWGLASTELRASTASWNCSGKRSTGPWPTAARPPSRTWSQTWSISPRLGGSAPTRLLSNYLR